MKNLMQKLVRTTLCVGVVSLTLVACSSDTATDENVITLDQLDDLLVDTMDIEDDSLSVENLNPEMIEEDLKGELEDVKKEEE
jgi:hypothetical protein